MEREASLQNVIFHDSLRYLKDCKSQARGEAGEGEDDGGDDVEDGQLGGVPVGQGPAGVEDQPKVGQVVAHALCLHLVAPLNDHLVEKKTLSWTVLSKLFTSQPASLQSCKS